MRFLACYYRCDDEDGDDEDDGEEDGGDDHDDNCTMVAPCLVWK